MRVFINPGHAPDGKPDAGACGYGLRECDVALSIGKLVEKYLAAVGYDVRLLQSDRLDEICDAANYFDADIFVSIHCNASTGNAHGTETFCYYDSIKGKRLAECIHQQIVKSLPLTNRGTKEAGFYVLAYSGMPAVLVETAFIDHEGDAKLLRNRQDDFARAIARGVTDYFAK